ncbi:MAG: excinuclease ABC subunit UvrC [Nitrospirae bacterium]|nr:excinuclease ABC subunit UvrC [Nitrospirota bacterium]
MKPDLSNTLANIPSRTGVYLLKGQKERILYVGKAKNLKNRLKSYFHDPSALDARKRAMAAAVRDVSFIVTDNELEALILEATLIKQYKPKFNIILRDDKNYPYIMITISEKWPRIEVVRRIKRDGNLYFGPYVPAQAMWEALSFIRKNFFVRTCRYALDKPMRPCIQYQMKRCPAPCAGIISKKRYMGIVEEVRLFLLGKRQDLLNKIEDNMQRLAAKERFEEAAAERDKLARLNRVFESQRVIDQDLGDMDVVGRYIDIKLNDSGIENITLSVNVLFIRSGVLIGARDFIVNNMLGEDEHEMMRCFIELFYSKDTIPPEVILTPVMPNDVNTLMAWMRAKRGDAVRIETPDDEKKHRIIEMANENAKLHYASRKKTGIDDLLITLHKRLKLKKPPLSICAFDVSTIQGSESVGAFIFWQKGQFVKEKYRHLKIKGVQGVDDYAMMRELVGRILLRLGGRDHGVDDEEGVSHPDLIIIDGGRGQLETAKSAMRELGIDTDVIGVAKKPDRAFLTDGDIINLEDGSAASLLLRRIRDEAHRFAVSYHRKLRDKRLTEAIVDKVEGIGKKRRLEILRRFGSIEKIRTASIEEVAAVKGFNLKIAERLIKAISTA